MRIVAGKWRGRRIEAPSGDDVRPTLDRVREAWMSILQTDIPDARVLDLFAGSGALGLEALSRGAASVTLVEKSVKSIRVMESNIDALGAADVATINRGDAILFAKGLSQGDFDVAFADPPYDGGFAPLLASIWLETQFAGGRHQLRVDKIMKIEQRERRA